MNLEYEVKVRNYKCFGDEPQGFDRICPINVIIGKNSAGKSTLIELIEQVIESKNPAFKESAKVVGSATVTPKFWEDLAKYNENVMRSSTGNWLPDILHWVANNPMPEKIEFELVPDTPVKLIKEAILGQYSRGVQLLINGEIRQRRFMTIQAERDITPEYPNNTENLRTGAGVTNIIWRFLTTKRLDQNIIKKHFLKALNQVVNPDMEFRDIMTKQDITENGSNAAALVEIQFEIHEGTWVDLSKMGSGIKTIILVLMHLIVLPARDKFPVNRYFFGFEEIENNLHPSLQRRLFQFIANFAQQQGAYFFLSTHSSVVIDLFAFKDYAQIIHVERIGKEATTTTVSSFEHGRNVLRDLDYKASDLLLTNGVIWVEGPSDVVYIQLWIDLYKKRHKLERELSYSIQPLSTALWKFAGFSELNWSGLDEDTLNKIVSLAKLNHNNLLVLDRDDNYEDKPPSCYNQFEQGTGRNKARLIHECLQFNQTNETKLLNNFGDLTDGRLAFWVNEATIETYLDHFLLNKGQRFQKYFDGVSSTESVRKKVWGKTPLNPK